MKETKNSETGITFVRSKNFVSVAKKISSATFPLQGRRILYCINKRFTKQGMASQNQFNRNCYNTSAVNLLSEYLLMKNIEVYKLLFSCTSKHTILSAI